MNDGLNDDRLDAPVQRPDEIRFRDDTDEASFVIDDRNVMMTVFGKDRHELDDVSVHARDSHVRRHDLADDFRLREIERRP